MLLYQHVTFKRTTFNIHFSSFLIYLIIKYLHTCRDIFILKLKSYPLNLL